MENKKHKYGQFVWTDVTVENPTELKEFYKDVFGWSEFAVGMKDGDEEYNDFAMMIDEETPAGGVCTKRGQNKEIPSQWIMYINVENIDESLEKCLQLGGKLIHENRKKDGSLHYVIVSDPKGHVFGMGRFDS